MNKFLSLLYCEVNKIGKIFFIALISLVSFSSIAAFINAKNDMNGWMAFAINQNSTVSELVKSGEISRISNRDMIVGNGILLCGAIFLMLNVFVYAFIIWYREWMGNNKTIYSLLTLPIDRMNVYMVKLITVILMGLSVASTFIIGLIATFYIQKAVYIKEVFSEVTLLGCIGSLFYQFIHLKLLLILTCISMVTLIFILILLERSFKIKGIFLGVFVSLSFIALIIFIAQNRYLYTVEKISIICVLDVVSILLSIIYGRYLIKNKVTV